MSLKPVLITLSLAIVFLICGMSSEANAQRRVPKYRSQSTISPWVLSRDFNRGTPIGQYFGYIQPRQQVNQFMTRQGIQNNMIQRQQLGFEQSLMQQQEQIDQPATSGGLLVRPATVSQFAPATFMNFSHYYTPTRVGGR